MVLCKVTAQTEEILLGGKFRLDESRGTSLKTLHPLFLWLQKSNKYHLFICYFYIPGEAQS